MFPWIDGPIRCRPARARLRFAVVLLLMLIGGVGPAHPLQASAAEDPEARLEEFLARLGLVELQIRHVEQLVDQATDPAQRQAYAVRAADLYAAQLIASAADKPKYDDLLRRIGQLVEKFPAAQTAALEVMLLQADYQRAEQLVSQWLASPEEATARQEAAAILARIAPLLEKRRQELQNSIEKLQGEVETTTNEDARAIQEQELARVQSVAGRAAYFAAWSQYYLGRVEADQDQGRKAIAQARDAFRRMLAIDDYKELDGESLGLSSIWRARALVGLALSEAGSGNVAASRICFDLLEKSAVPAEIRDQVPNWRLESLLSAGDHAAALQLARERVKTLTGSATQGKVSFCVSLVRAAYGRGPTRPAGADELGQLGLVGLIKMRQLRAVRELMAKYPIGPEAAGGFYLRWVRGQELFERAERTKSPEDYRAAADELRAALQSEDAARDVAAAAQCRYQLGWALYRLEQWEEAARTFREAVSGLQAGKDAAAVEAAWMAFAAYASLAKSDPRFLSSATAMLELVKREFPNHERAKQADYQLSRLKSRVASPQETLASLEKVSPGTANYLDARFDICRLRHRLWSEGPEGERAKAAQDLFAAIDVYLAAPGATRDAERTVKCLLLGADAALQQSTAETDRAAGYLDRAEPLVAALPGGSELSAEYHYRRLQLAGRAGNDAARLQHAEWLVKNAAGSAFELAGLVAAAKAVDAKVAAAGPAEKATLQQEAYALYQRLGRLWGDDPDVLQRTKNAQVAQSKKAYYAVALGRHAEAAQQLDRLVAAFPDHRDYLRRAGLAHFQAGSYGKSLQAWRTLLAGLPRGSEDWFEAKYYQLACLFQTDEPTARAVWAQFKLLYPELGPAAWRARFQEFDRK